MNKIKGAFLPHAEKRQQQLKKEEKLDEELAKLPCHQSVIKYYQAERNFNRTAYFTAYTDMWNYKEHINNNLERVETHQRSLKSALRRSDPCKSLEIVTRLINDHSKSLK